uniref:DNA-directed RNA polymerase subunit n=1 Tax=Phaeomonas parva TaxID=124430 RepID=A0A7S1XKH4_9STRA|mmetsp:Transcript_1218/g.3275  ORF Transcript_1218/g.3275 Transcript_1218/m.3275 type:complete len:108 (+) Transcript_1218:200-523(+)
MQFCPPCGNLLLVESAGSGFRFFCSTCPYVCNITERLKSSLRLKRKQVDDVLGGAEAWENVDKTAADCPSCGAQEAYFMQIQIRSADEPSTRFYKCVNCAHTWTDNS